MRKKLPLTNILIIVALGLLTALGSVLSGIVSSQIPPALTKYLQYAWLAFGLVTLALIALTVWQFLRQTGPEPSVVDTSKNREIMLNRVWAKWIAGFLENPLYYDEELLPLPLRERVGSRYALALFNPLEPAHSLPPDTRIQEVFDQGRGQLLILGEPGAGKTTLLLELARDLLQRARNHEEALIPVVLTLSSWATMQLPLEQWVIEELKTKYQVATEIGQAWVDNNQLLLLLDGLDEVAPHAQPACIRAVSRYTSQTPRSLVVCSRTNEYLEQPERLSLRTAVAIQPLSPQQVDDYLSALGEEVDGLKHTLQQSEPLRTLATTPLLLKVLILAYHGKTEQDLLPLVNTTPTGQQHRLFHDYVERMLQREGPRMRAPEQRTKHWLAWLAHQLTEHHQTEFYLEQLQQDWLPTKQRALYRWSVGLVVAMICYLLFWPVVALLNGLIFGLLAALGICLAAGLFVGVLIVLNVEIEPADLLMWTWKDARGIVGIGLGVGLLFGLDVGLQSGLREGLLSGLFIGLITGLVVGLLYGGSSNWGGSLDWVQNRSQLFGISSKRLSEDLRLSPNEGMRRSPKNGAVLGLLVGLCCGLTNGLLVGLANGLLAGVSIGLFIGLVFGLFAVIQHYTLRLWLWRAECTPAPWRYIAFLEDAADQLLLRKAGGGYVFRHPLLQEYFASSDVVPPQHHPFHAEARPVVQNAPDGYPSL